MDLSDRRAVLRACVERAVASALRRSDAGRAVRESLRVDASSLSAAGVRVPTPRQLVVLGWGKAGVPMLRGALAVLAAASRRPDAGLVVVKEGHAEGLAELGGVRIVEAGHPVPDARGERAANEMLALAGSLRHDDVALVLGSGGGSALLALPRAGLRLEDVAGVTRALLVAGAEIHEINAIRKHASAIAGGQLAVAMGDAASLALLVSDVPGDDPATIASGPTAPDPTTFADARAALARHVGSPPPRLAALLARGARGEEPETPKPGHPGLARHHHVIVASCRDARVAALASLASDGFRVTDLGSTGTGPADAVAARLVATLLEAARTGEPVAVVGGGETTVVVTGSAPGGRNQHLAAHAARALHEHAPGGLACAVAAVATDGEDGTTSAAGGLVDDRTWTRAGRGGLDPAALLSACRAHEILRATGDLLVTGPTATNVMDLHVAAAAPERA